MAEKMKEERRIGTAQVAKRFLGGNVEIVEKEEKSTESAMESGVTPQATIGSTTISSTEK